MLDVQRLCAQSIVTLDRGQAIFPTHSSKSRIHHNSFPGSVADHGCENGQCGFELWSEWDVRTVHEQIGSCLNFGDVWVLGCNGKITAAAATDDLYGDSGVFDHQFRVNQA